MSEVVGNPQPNLRANVAQSGMNPVEVEVVDDTVITSGSNMAHSINITCVATNSIGAVATAVGSLNFGSKGILTYNHVAIMHCLIHVCLSHIIHWTSWLDS